MTGPQRTGANKPGSSSPEPPEQTTTETSEGLSDTAAADSPDDPGDEYEPL